MKTVISFSMRMDWSGYRVKDQLKERRSLQLLLCTVVLHTADERAVSQKLLDFVGQK